MSTRSHVGILREDGNVRHIYVHFDGYAECVGRVLLERVKTLQDAEALISLGSMESLGWLEDASVGKRLYGEPAEVSSLGEFTEFWGAFDAEYAYLLDPRDGQWYAATEHGPIARHVHRDTERVFGACDAWYPEIKWEQRRELIRNSVYGKASKTFYPASLLLAYEALNSIEYAASKGHKACERDARERLQGYLESGLVSEGTLREAECLDASLERERQEGLEELKRQAGAILDALEAAWQGRLGTVEGRTAYHSPKETAKLVRKAIKEAGIGGISVTTLRGSLDGAVGVNAKDSGRFFSQEEIGRVNGIIESFNARSAQQEEAVRACAQEGFVPEPEYFHYAYVRHFHPACEGEYRPFVAV